jgi:adenine-specific DNA methylase
MQGYWRGVREQLSDPCVAHDVLAELEEADHIMLFREEDESLRIYLRLKGLHCPHCGLVSKSVGNTSRSASENAAS